MRQAVLFSVGFASMAALVGLGISAELSLTSGATIALAGVYVLVGLVRRPA